MNELQNTLVGILAIWFVGLGVAIMCRWQKQYISWTKKLIVQPVLRLIKRLWAKYRKEILLLALGIIIGIAIARNFSTLSL